MGLAEKFAKTPVRDLNLREMPIVDPDVLVRDAIAVMRAADLGCVMVVEGGQPAGMFTEGLLREEFARNPGVVDELVATHMAVPFPKIYLDDTVDMVLLAMQANNTRFICVVDADETVIGLTGQKGLMEFVAEEFPRQVMVQRIGGTFPMTQREGA